MYLFSEGEEEREKERETSMCEMVASHTPPAGELAHNPGECPALGSKLRPFWESNQRPFSLKASTQSIEPYLPGPDSFCNTCSLYYEHFQIYRKDKRVVR